MPNGDSDTKPDERRAGVNRNRLAPVRRTRDPPIGPVAVPVPTALLVLTEAEYV